jgi:predicted dithiol-disulfide oxidoreductase (DUF899 family)
MKREKEKQQMNLPRVVSEAEWLVARKQLLTEEKEFTRQRDALSAKRRKLPMVKIEKEYVFEGRNGKESLADLFDGRSQLIVYHFMFAPDWDEGCPHCSFWADNFNNIIVHLNQRDLTMVAISRAPLKKLQDFEKRMGWTFKWLSSGGNDFNYDYNASFSEEDVRAGVKTYNFNTQAPFVTDHPGVSVFYKNKDGSIFRTYSAYSRGIDMLNTAYNYLDLVPKGRDEGSLESPQGWVDYHDRYAVTKP